MRAILLSVGDELVLGQTVDTNSAYLAGELAKRGIHTAQHLTLADDQPELAEAIDHAAQRCDLLIITGGIGPTPDDLTRQALAQAMKVELVENPQALQTLRNFFKMRGKEMSDSNRIQAQHPQGSTLIDNPLGTAPGICAKWHQAQIFVTPGVPREMRDMYQQSIRPILTITQQDPILTTTLHTFGQGESTIAQQLDKIMARDRNPTVGTTVADGICSIRIRGDDPAALEQTARKVQSQLGSIYFGRDEQTLQQSVVEQLKQKKFTLATAESCTGGLISKMITDVPGSSDIYLGGWVTYTNTLKHNELDVPPEVIESQGAVSEAVATAMARGAMRRSGANLALATTGIAGPDGGTTAKPVGTVWIALTTAGKTFTTHCHFPGDRQSMRDRSAKAALQTLRWHLLGEPMDDLPWSVVAKPLIQAAT